jgi:hypothetical protein
LAAAVGLPLFVHTRHTVFMQSPRSRCGWPWGGVFIATDSSLAPCCLVADPHVACLGKLDGGDFSTVWNGEAYRAQRRAFKAGLYPDYCRQCRKQTPVR